ncbi:hypothetical protein MGC_02540 [Candida albicans P37039]|nr:hypothetical protein MGC_02540 [Candida albicans P37039]
MTCIFCYNRIKNDQVSFPKKMQVAIIQKVMFMLQNFIFPWLNATFSFLFFFSEFSAIIGPIKATQINETVLFPNLSFTSELINCRRILFSVKLLPPRPEQSISMAHPI